MRYLILISGISSFILLLIWKLGFPSESLLWISAVILFVFITLPLYITNHIKHNKKIKSIIKEKSQNESENSNKNKISPNSKPIYPSFRKQKKGLTWGGGNIHASNAFRGEKRTFLKK